MLHQAASCKLHTAAARMKINASVGRGVGGVMFVSMGVETRHYMFAPNDSVSCRESTHLTLPLRTIQQHINADPKVSN